MKQIWRIFLVGGFIVLAAVNCRSAQTMSREQFFAPPKIQLQPIPDIHISPSLALPKEERTRIQKLIRSLSEVQNPDFGLSATLSGRAFAPLPGMEDFQSGILMNHGIKASDVVTELVKLGPKAIPFLLDSLQDQTPTKLVVTHDSMMGGMWFANELSGNPSNVDEQTIIGPGSKDRPWHQLEDDLKSYTVKVGDVCYVILGQIVGRSYEAVRYQPTACIVINSPTHDTNLAAQVRAIWSSGDAAQYLLKSLLIDYASRGVFNGQSLDGWSVGSDLQVSAAMRLLYYFPVQTTNLIAGRLHCLDVGKYDLYREVSNGVRAEDFIKAVAWSKEPTIRAELRRIFRNTSEPDILVATVGAMDAADEKDFQKRLEEFISNIPADEKGPYGDNYKLLVALGRQFGDRARPAYDRFMEHASLRMRRAMCRVLEEVHGDWSVDLLGHVLTDVQPAEGWNYAVVPGQNEPRLPIRICDEAAATISRNFPKLKFKMAGQHKDLDQQIAKMRDQIAKHDY